MVSQGVQQGEKGGVNILLKSQGVLEDGDIHVAAAVVHSALLTTVVASVEGGCGDCAGGSETGEEAGDELHCADEVLRKRKVRKGCCGLGSVSAKSGQMSDGEEKRMDRDLRKAFIGQGGAGRGGTMLCLWEWCDTQADGPFLRDCFPEASEAWKLCST